MNTICLNCDTENKFTGASNDELGWHVMCPICDTSYDIDIEKYLIPNGTKVTYWGNGVGIVDGNDANDSEEFNNINYFVCPIEFTHEKNWSDYYNMFRRDEFELASN